MDRKPNREGASLSAIKPDRNKLKQIRNRFDQLSALRLQRLKSALLPAQRQFLDILTALLHCNHPALPGYGNQSTPCGIQDYLIRRNVRQLLERNFPGFKPADSNTQQLEIQGLYLMGSSGTLAQNLTSDLDCWVCLNEAPSKATRKALQEKLDAISEWASKLRLELHFFIMHDESFKQKLRADMSVEDCGETQHYLLLDEFYRTAIPLAGRSPLWWILPCDTKLERDVNEQTEFYSSYRNVILSQKFISQSDYLDFGDTGVIPIREYLSASVWTLYKALQSPYKALIKLMLLESYVVQHGKTQNLSDQLKLLLHKDGVDIKSLDPYVQIYKHIEQYLKDTQQTKRLDLLRRCFYRKIDINVSQLSPALLERIRASNLDTLKTGRSLKIKPYREKTSNHSNKNDISMWRHKIFLPLIDEWGWDGDRVAEEDNINNWPIAAQLRERRDIDYELLSIYRFIDHTAKQLLAIDEYDAHRQSPEMLLLERQLKVVFKHSKFKVGYRVADIDTRLVKHPARKLTLYNKSFAHSNQDQSRAENDLKHIHSGHKNWALLPNQHAPRLLHKSDIESNQANISPLYSANTIEQLMLWSQLNGLANKKTIYDRYCSIPNKSPDSSAPSDIHTDRIARHIREFLTTDFKSDAAIRQLDQKSEVLRCMLLINSQDNDHESTLWDKVVLSERDDPLAYTGMPHNMIWQLSMTWENNWGEIYHRQFAGHQAIQEAVMFYQSFNRAKYCQPSFHCISTERSSAVTKRLQQLFTDAIVWLSEGRKISTQTEKNTRADLPTHLPHAYVFATADGVYATVEYANANNQSLYWPINQPVFDILQILSKRWKLMLDPISIDPNYGSALRAKSLLG